MLFLTNFDYTSSIFYCLCMVVNWDMYYDTFVCKKTRLEFERLILMQSTPTTGLLWSLFRKGVICIYEGQNPFQFDKFFFFWFVGVGGRGGGVRTLKFIFLLVFTLSSCFIPSLLFCYCFVFAIQATFRVSVYVTVFLKLGKLFICQSSSIQVNKLGLTKKLRRQSLGVMSCIKELNKKKIVFFWNFAFTPASRNLNLGNLNACMVI